MTERASPSLTDRHARGRRARRHGPHRHGCDTALYADENHQYRTATSGGAGMGDGLNTRSNHPFEDFERVMWNDCTDTNWRGGGQLSDHFPHTVDFSYTLDLPTPNYRATTTSCAD